MEKFNYYFNTRERIDSVLSTPVNKNTVSSILFHLVWDAYYNLSTDENDIIKYIKKWMSENYKSFNLAIYAKPIKQFIKNMDKIPWRNIQESIKIRKSELEYISSFDDIKKEKLLFCYLAIAKFCDASRESPSHWESESDTTVFKMARITIPASDRDYFINILINDEPKAKIYMNYKNDDTSKRIDYISDNENDPVVLELDESNYYELAFTYLNWKNNGGYKKCLGCGKLFQIKKRTTKKDDKNKILSDNATLYCKECSTKYEPKYKCKEETDINYEPKKITCIDCGATVYIDNYKNSRTCRCEECQKIARQKINKEYYDKNKTEQF